MKNVFGWLLAVSTLFSSINVHGADIPACEKMSGTYVIKHHGQSFPASYVGYRLEITFDNDRDLKLFKNWRANTEETWEADDLVNIYRETLPPGSWDGARQHLAVADPEGFLSSLNYTTLIITVAERNINRYQDNLEEKKAALACAKKRLKKMAEEVRRKYLQTRQVDLHN